MCTKANNKKGEFGFWGLIVFLSLIYIMNIAGDPPPSVDAIAFVGLFQWLLVAWGYRNDPSDWIDRNRTALN